MKPVLILPKGCVTLAPKPAHISKIQLPPGVSILISNNQTRQDKMHVAAVDSSDTRKLTKNHIQKKNKRIVRKDAPAGEQETKIIKCSSKPKRLKSEFKPDDTQIIASPGAVKKNLIEYSADDKSVGKNHSTSDRTFSLMTTTGEMRKNDNIEIGNQSIDKKISNHSIYQTKNTHFEVDSPVRNFASPNPLEKNQNLNSGDSDTAAGIRKEFSLDHRQPNASIAKYVSDTNLTNFVYSSIDNSINNPNYCPEFTQPNIDNRLNYADSLSVSNTERNRNSYANVNSKSLQFYSERPQCSGTNWGPQHESPKDDSTCIFNTRLPPPYEAVQSYDDNIDSTDNVIMPYSISESQISKAPPVEHEQLYDSNNLEFYDAYDDCHDSLNPNLKNAQSISFISSRHITAKHYSYESSNCNIEKQISDSAFENEIHCEDEPRDYSNTAYSRDKNDDDLEFFLKKVTQAAGLEESQDPVYLERKCHAKAILDKGSGVERAKILKNNFYIIEDEPLRIDLIDQNENEISNDPPKKGKRVSKEFICQVCGVRLKGRSALRSHLNRHSGKKPYKCKNCLKSFTQLSTLKNHIRIHTGETPYACTKCDATFKTLSVLTQHKLKHSDSTPFECLICSKSFKTNLYLRKHMLIHSESPRKCKKCFEEFDDRKKLTEHMRAKHRKKEIFQCPYCTKKYPHKSKLNYHMNVHSNIRKYVCKVCKADFVWKNGLSSHLRTHFMKIKCDICDKNFVSVEKLNKHRLTHTFPKSHECSKCSKIFKFLYQMKAHFKRHKDELVCAVCSVGFLSYRKLKEHAVMHQ